MEAAFDVSLRPLRLGEILDATLRLYRRNFWLFVGVITLAEIPFLLVQVVLPLIYTGAKTSEGEIFSLHWWVINGANFLMRWIFVDSIGALALSYVVSQRYLHQDANLFSVYGRVVRSLLGLAGVMFVLPALLLAIVIWGIFIPCVGWIGSWGAFIFLTLVVMPLIPVVLAVERQPSLKAILRSWDLARRRFFWLMFFNSMLVIFGWTLAAGPSLVASSLVSTAIDQSMGASMESLYGIIWSVSGTLFNMLFLPIQIGAWTVTYYDVRVRSEAFDLALLVADEPEDINKLIQLPPANRWFSWLDIGKIGSISLIIVAFFVFLQALQYIFIVLALLVARTGN